MSKSSLSVHYLTVSAAFVIAGGCLEANPYADTGTAGDTSGSADTNGTNDTNGTTETTGEELCDGFACGMGLETHAFSVQGGAPYSQQIPKPPQAHTIPFATVHVYEPGNGDDYGYEISWTESGDSWTLEISTEGGAGNSRVRGVAAVLGLGTDVGEPALQSAELTADEGCASLDTGALDGRLFVDAIQRYSPGGDANLSYTRTATVGDNAMIEYCISSSDTPEAAIAFSVLSFPIPPESTSMQIDAITLDSASAQSLSFPDLGSPSAVAHLVSAHSLDEVAAPDMGYTFDCDTQAPFGCTFEITGFADGALVEAGGTVLAAP